MLNERKQRGFTLVEVLIAMVVLSIGLLGLAGLQATGLRTEQSAFQRSQATILAYDILDAMRANRQAARDGDYNLALADAAPSGDTLAAKDLRNWLAALTARLPQGDGAVNVTNDIATITVQWKDSRGETDADGNPLPPQQFVVESQL